MGIELMSETQHITRYEVGGNTGPVYGLWVAESISNAHYTTADLRGEVDLFNFLSDRGELIKTFTSENGYAESLWRLEVDDTLVLAVHSSGDDIYLKLSSNANDGGKQVRKTLGELVGLIHPLPKLDELTTRVRFWYRTDEGPKNSTRKIAIPKWEDIKSNYSKNAAKDLEDLMHLDHKRIGNGRILLMHGPPGTGKTHSIRALFNAWKPWCESEYVVDPEQAFGNASYLVKLLLDGNPEQMEDGSDQTKWRLLVLEDAEEFLRPGAKQEVGQSVARLLNFGDGLLGQGLNVLVLMTTNVEINELHEAITRPGRCLSNINVPKLTKEEASKWLGSPHEEATLAELFEAKSSSQIGRGIEETPRPGNYL